MPEIYVDREGQPLPMLLRSLHRGLSYALKRTFFEFTRSRTTHRPPHFQSLGRRSIVRAVWFKMKSGIRFGGSCNPFE